MKFIYKIILTAITALVLANFLPGIEVYSFESALVLAIVLGFLNTFLKPILILLTLPITVLSLGLFLLILNAIIVFTTSYFVSGFIDSSWLGAILFGVLMTLADSLIRGLVDDD
jgi:putative membrane protein